MTIIEIALVLFGAFIAAVGVMTICVRALIEEWDAIDMCNVGTEADLKSENAR